MSPQIYTRKINLFIPSFVPCNPFGIRMSIVYAFSGADPYGNPDPARDWNIYPPNFDVTTTLHGLNFELPPFDRCVTAAGREAGGSQSRRSVECALVGHDDGHVGSIR